MLPFLMKRVLLICFIGLTSIFEAQNLYGITTNTATNLSCLASINPVTGSVTPISFPGISTSPNQSVSALDPINKRYYIIGYGDTLNVIDLTSGNIILQKRLSSSPTYTTESIEFNCMDTTLYAISGTTLSYLSKIDPLTASVTILSSSGFTGGSYASTIDPIKKRYYFMSNNDSIISVSLTTGKKISEKKLSNWFTYDVASIEYNSVDTTLYALSTKKSNWLNYLSKLNSFTGSVTITSPIGFGQNVCTGMSSIDPVGNQYFFNGCNDTLYCVNVNTGNLASKPRFSNYSVAGFSSIDFEQQLCSSPLNIQESVNTVFSNSIGIYPQPAKDLVNISLNYFYEKSIEVNVVDVNGRIVRSAELGVRNGKAIIETSEFSNGVYILQLKDPQGQVANKRLIIAR